MSLLTQIESDVAGVFLNTDDFAEAVTYTPDGGSGVSIDVIWDEAFETIDMQEGIEVRGHTPACFAQESDITGTGEGDTIVRNSITYYIRHIIGEQSQGIVLLLLSKEAIHGG